MIDVEHRALGAFEHDRAALTQDAVQQPTGVGDKGSDLLGGSGVFVVHDCRIERVGPEKGMRYCVLLCTRVFDMGLEQIGAHEIHNAQSIAGHLVFICGADAAAGSANSLSARGTLGSQFDHAVIGQNDLSAIGNEKLAVDFDAEAAELGNFLEECNWVEDNAVANHALASLAENAAGNKLQHEFLSAVNYRMPGIVPARVACHRAEPLAEHVHDFSLALVAPLGSEHDRRLRSHVFFASRKSSALAGAGVESATQCQARKTVRRSRSERVSGYAGKSRAHIADCATNDSKPSPDRPFRDPEFGSGLLAWRRNKSN